MAPLDGSRSLLAGTVSREYQRPFGWVALVDGTGTKNWEQRVGVPGSSLSAAVATDEGAVLAGRLNGPSGTQRGPSSEESDSSPWVLHVTERGDVTWTRTFQPDAAASTTRGLTARDGGYAVCGSVTVDDWECPWASGLAPGGDLDWEWTRSVDRNAGSAQAVAPTAQGVVLGCSSHDREGESAWVARVRGDGMEVWHRELLATEAKSRIEALVPRNGGVLAVGQRGFHAQDHGTAWAVALDASGETVWEQEYPREQWNWVRDARRVGAPTRRRRRPPRGATRHRRREGRRLRGRADAGGRPTARGRPRRLRGYVRLARTARRAGGERRRRRPVAPDSSRLGSAAAGGNGAGCGHRRPPYSAP